VCGVIVVCVAVLLQTHQFCSRCGLATVPTEGGARRRCTNRPAHKLYPRTDPVVSSSSIEQGKSSSSGMSNISRLISCMGSLHCSSSTGAAA